MAHDENQIKKKGPIGPAFEIIQQLKKKRALQKRALLALPQTPLLSNKDNKKEDGQPNNTPRA